MQRFTDEEYHMWKDFEFLITDNDIEKLKQGKTLFSDVDEEYTVILKYYEGGKMNKEDYQEVLERMEQATGNEVFCDVMCRFPYELNEEQLTEVCERCPLTESCEDSSQTITNLKKLKSFHNGSYGADIDKAIKALEQNAKYRKEAKRWKNKALGQRTKINPEGNVVYGRDGNLYELTLSNGKEYEQEPMRDATSEERKSVNDYVKSISKPTGVKFDFDEEQEQIEFVQPHKTVGKLISVDVLDKIRDEIKVMTSNRGFLSCSVGHIHEEIDNVFDRYKAESEVLDADSNQFIG